MPVLSLFPPGNNAWLGLLQGLQDAPPGVAAVRDNTTLFAYRAYETVAHENRALQEGIIHVDLCRLIILMDGMLLLLHANSEEKVIFTVLQPTKLVRIFKQSASISNSRKSILRCAAEVTVVGALSR